MPKLSKESNEIFLNEIIEKVKTLPKKYIESLHTITIMPFENRSDAYWRKEFSNPNHLSAASAGKGKINFYKLGDVRAPFELSKFEISERVMRHEFGHILAGQLYGSATPPKSWIDAMESDGKKRVSNYAYSRSAEDFAETVEFYFRISKEGLKNSQWKDFSYRFAELDRIFLNDPNLRYEINTMIKIRRKLPLVIAITMTSDTTYYFYQHIEDEKVTP